MGRFSMTYGALMLISEWHSDNEPFSKAMPTVNFGNFSAVHCFDIALLLKFMVPDVVACYFLPRRKWTHVQPLGPTPGVRMKHAFVYVRKLR